MATSTMVSNKIVFKYEEDAEKASFTMPYLANNISSGGVEEISSAILDIQAGTLDDMRLVATYDIEK